MHPAPSIIVFTTLSGLGFGLMAWLGTRRRRPRPPCALRPRARLGRPAREPAAPRPAAALPQGLQPVAELLAQPRGGPRHRHPRRLRPLRRALGLPGLRTRLLGVPAAALALATVVATAMIYAQIGACRAGARRSRRSSSCSSGWPAARSSPAAGCPWLLAALGVVQVAAWDHGDRRFGRSGITLATATGLGALGRLRCSSRRNGPNHLLREMVFVVGRRHAAEAPRSDSLLAVLLPLAGVFLPPRRPLPSPVRRLLHVSGAWSCAGSSSRRPSTWLDSTTEAPTPGPMTGEPRQPSP